MAKESYCERLEISGHPSIVFKKNDAPSKGAILYLYGGGMITGPDKMDIRLADRLVKKTGRDVYFPLYPLCIDRSVVESYHVCFAVYKKMLEYYAPDQINVLGFSSGAALALGIFLYNNETKMPLPVAHKIVAVSPGGLPNENDSRDREILAKLAELSPRDILIDAQYFLTAREILRHGDDVPEYMLNGIKGNFEHFPETHLVYGSEETLYAFAPYFCEALKEQNIPHSLIVGEGMCHCYPLFRFFKEGREAQDDIIARLQ